MPVPRISSDELLLRLSEPGRIVVLFVGNGPLQDRVLAELQAALKLCTLRGLRCFIINATVPPGVRDNRITAVRVPQVRLFENGKQMQTHVGAVDVIEFFNTYR